jgi:hypothetical protein
MTILQVGTRTDSAVVTDVTNSVTRTGVKSASFLSLVVVSSVVAPSGVPDGWDHDFTVACTDAPGYTTNFYSKTNAIAGDHTAVINYPSSSVIRMTITEWKGMFTVTKDKTSGYSFYNNVYNTGSTGTLTTAVQLAIAALQFAASSGISITIPTGGWVDQGTISSPIESSVISLITSATTALNPTWTAAGGNQELANGIVTYIPGTAPTAATLSSPGRTTILSTSVVGTFTSDTAGGTAFAAVSTSGTPPSAAQIDAGTGGGIVAVGTATALSGANAVTTTGLTPSTTYYVHMMQDNGSQSNIVSSTSFTTLPPAPNITGVSSMNPTKGSSFTVTGTDFGSTQSTGYLKVGGTTLTITSWSSTSITGTMDPGLNKYGITVDVIVASSSVGEGPAFAITTLQPPVGSSFINLVTPYAISTDRITASADAASGDQYEYVNFSNLFTVYADLTWSAAESVSSSNGRLWTPGSGWGSYATQTIDTGGYVPPADTIVIGGHKNTARMELPGFNVPAYSVVWSDILNSEKGAPVSFVSITTLSIQVTGVFGSGGSIKMEGSTDGITYTDMVDGSSNPLIFTSATTLVSTDVRTYMRPKVTAGDGNTNLKVKLIAS